MYEIGYSGIFVGLGTWEASRRTKPDHFPEVAVYLFADSGGTD